SWAGWAPASSSTPRPSACGARGRSGAATPSSLAFPRHRPAPKLGVFGRTSSMSDPAIQKLGALVYPVPDVPAAVAFYRDVVGLTLRFQDADRYAAFEVPGGGSIALAGPGEDVTGGRPAASLKVADVRATVEALCARGARLVRAPQEGPHEL